MASDACTASARPTHPSSSTVAPFVSTDVVTGEVAVEEGAEAPDACGNSEGRKDSEDENLSSMRVENMESDIPL